MRAALLRAHIQTARSTRLVRNLLMLLAALCVGFELGMLMSVHLPDRSHATCCSQSGHLAPTDQSYGSRLVASLDALHSDQQDDESRVEAPAQEDDEQVADTVRADEQAGDCTDSVHAGGAGKEEEASSDTAEWPPYVQSLDADWQRHWLSSSNVSTPNSTYRTLADAICLPFHETANRTQCVLPRTNDELVREAHVAYSVCGSGVREMALTSIKSFILHRHSSVTLHFWLILSPYTAQRGWITDTIARWPPQYQPHPLPNASPHSSVHLHFLDMDALLSSNHSVLRRASPHLTLFRPCSTLRMWLPQLLPSNVSLVLYVDCDTLVVRDYRQIFAHAQLYTGAQILSFAYEGTSKQCGSWYFLKPPPQPAPQPYAINAGVMLIDLSRARSPAMQYVYTERLLQLLSSGSTFLMGDQDVYNRWIGAMQAEGRDLYFPLPLSYNWRECEFIPPGERGGLTLMHGNAYKFYNRNEEPFWEATYQSYFLWQHLPSNLTMKIKQ